LTSWTDDCTTYRVMATQGCCFYLAVGLLLASLPQAWARIISVPDLHGDYDNAVQILVAAKLINRDSLHWIGGDAKLVQTGDITDRGDKCKQIYELFFKLASEASEVGGAVVNLLGNHEVMNIMGDLRYVSQGDVEQFGGADQRARAWAPQGWLGSHLRQLPVAQVVGKVLFVHAGVLPDILKHESVEKLNIAFRAALAHVDASKKEALVDNQMIVSADDDKLLGDEGPVWARDYAMRDSAGICALAKEVLSQVGALRMVVGHTIQSDFHVHTHCSGHVVLGDTAVSKVYGGEMSFQEHDGNGGVTIYYPGTGDRVVLPALEGHAVNVEQEEKTFKVGLSQSAFMAFGILVAIALFFSWNSRRNMKQTPP